MPTARRCPTAAAALLLLCALIACALADDACDGADSCKACSALSACAWCHQKDACVSLASNATMPACPDGYCTLAACNCDAPWESFLWPYSGEIGGQLVLMFFYGVVLALGAKLIADGSELLMEILDPGLIGGLVLPVLGALPDGMMILISGALGSVEEAQEQIAVGMGTLAGSTVMLLTLVWGSALWLARTDIVDGESKDRVLTRKFDIVHTGATVDSDTPVNARIAIVTSLSYLIVQGVGFYYSEDPYNSTGVEIEQWCSLAGCIVCFLFLAAYCAYQVINPKLQAKKIERARHRAIQENVLEKLKSIALVKKIDTPDVETPAPSESTSLLPEDAPAPSPKRSLMASKWKAAANLARASESSINSTPEAPRLESVDEDAAADSDDGSGDDSLKDMSPTAIAVKAVALMLFGTALVSVFSDPMVDVITDFGKNIDVGAFYVSFIITPFCSNASELISSLIFAAKKKKKNSSLTFSALYGAATMNNTLCLGLFFGLVFFRKLSWTFSAEVFCILFAQWAVCAFGSFATTYRTWTVMAVFAVYPISLGLVIFLESSLIGWT